VYSYGWLTIIRVYLPSPSSGYTKGVSEHQEG
jgi:hypothetical protein